MQDTHRPHREGARSAIAKDASRRCRAGWLAGCLALTLALGGCGAVEAWRSVYGVAKNDPDPQTALFSKNLAAGEAAAYPNLATVPPPPSRATTTAERKKLTEALVADRAATEAARPAIAEAASPSARATRAAASQPDEPGSGPLTIAAAAAPGASAQGRGTASEPQAARRRSGEPSELPSRESSLEMPTMRATPEPEAARAAPSPPALAAVPRPVLAAAPPPAAAAVPNPPPLLPVIAPVAPPPGPPPGPTIAATPKRPAAATTVATVDLLGPSGTPDRGQIERVAAQYKRNPGTVRVVGYAAPPSGGDPLASYHAALERAQNVARALADAGIPSAKIQTEAARASGTGTPNAGQIDIQFTP